jgi:hypothetical protein
MSQANRTANNVEPIFHPGIPLRFTRRRLERCQAFDRGETSGPLVRGVRYVCRRIPPGPHRLRLDDTLAALKRLDDDSDPPPRGGLALRLPRFSKLECTASGEPQRFIDRHAAPRRYRSMQASRTPNQSRWTREANVRRYRKLLSTQLTDIEPTS